MDGLSQPREYLTDSVEQFAAAAAAYLPQLFTALVLVLAGLLLANLVRWLILRIGHVFDNLLHHTRLGALVRLRWPLSRLIAGAGYWLVLLLFFTAAAQSLGLPGFSESLEKIVDYIPSALAGFVIVVAGVVLGGVAREAVIAGAAASRMAHGEMLGGLIRNLVITLTVLIGLEQLGLRLGLVQNLLLILAAAVMLSLALGFGLGAAPTVANLIAIRNVRRHYRVGQSVRVGDVEGVILELSSAFVVLDTDNGRTLVPARSFEEQVSTLLEAEGDDAG
jgi:hypothetical protein